ncbi:MAG: hypothetical protein LBL23_07790 [Coriobacteriales bacterium]|jgi:hypothetical protein|nr:hypothetical protein [Coriobacteriales bacterium]
MKSKNLIFMLFTLACFVAAGVCLIVDMALSQHITWAVHPLLSIVFGWAAVSPLLLTKHGVVIVSDTDAITTRALSPSSTNKQGVLVSLAAVTLLILPYLYLLGGITATADWFVPVGLPSAITGIIALWILFLLFRFAKMNLWGKLAISIFLLGAVVSPVVNYFVDIYAEQSPFSWDIFLTIAVAVVASAILGILGYMKSKPKVETTEKKEAQTYEQI